LSDELAIDFKERRFAIADEAKNGDFKSPLLEACDGATPASC